MPGLRIITETQLRGSIAARRKALKLSQKQVAQKLGVDQAHLSNIESGARGLSVRRLLEILNILGLELVLRDSSSSRTQSLQADG